MTILLVKLRSAAGLAERAPDLLRELPRGPWGGAGVGCRRGQVPYEL
jgi:hypothetical protein